MSLVHSRRASRANTLWLALLASLALAATPARAQERELVVEKYPDGTPRVERQVLASKGAQVLDGSYRRFHPSGELAASGSYEAGAMSGEWTTFHENGKPRTKGSHNKGRRSGKWEFFWENGTKAAEGSYLLGLRDDRWLYWSADGVKDENESGLYRMKTEVHENRARKFAVETRNGVRHGRWASWWENGARQSEGHFSQGVRDAWWTLYHLDDSPERELVTGLYRDGERVLLELADVPPDPFAIPEEAEQSLSAQVDLARLPRLARASGVKPSQRTQIQGWVSLYLAGSEEEQLQAEQILLQHGRSAVPEILNELQPLDLESDDARAHGAKLTTLLHGVCEGLGFAWDPSAEPGAFEQDRLSILRWFSWWELVKANDAWWSSLPARAPNGPALLEIALLDFAGDTDAAAPAADAGAVPTKRSSLFESRAKAKRDRDAARAVADALAWLAAHQGADGSWDGDAFPDQCGKIGEERCDGTGEATHDIGLSALALLAFFGDGITSASEVHGDVVARGLAWLLEQQNGSGLFGKEIGAFLYDHAIATAVVCEALHFSDEPELADAAQRAVSYIQSARNQGLAWRYAVPPNGENDTSVTGWMVSALDAARGAGLEVDPAAFDGALTWIDRMTLKESGRVGYDSAGSRSSRVTDANAQYPVDKTEAMTAVGLWCRLLAGQDPATRPVLAKHADLILTKLPEWDPAAFKVDMYFWYYGTYAMARMGERYWLPWNEALKTAALASQRDEKQSDASGSWDPIDAWGWSGGRLYSTALMTLCLEGGWRYPLSTAKR